VSLGDGFTSKSTTLITIPSGNGRSSESRAVDDQLLLAQRCLPMKKRCQMTMDCHISVNMTEKETSWMNGMDLDAQSCLTGIRMKVITKTASVTAKEFTGKFCSEVTSLLLQRELNTAQVPVAALYLTEC